MENSKKNTVQGERGANICVQNYVGILLLFGFFSKDITAAVGAQLWQVLLRSQPSSRSMEFFQLTTQ